MTVQTVNLFSMTFDSGKKQVVSSESVKTFDSFLTNNTTQSVQSGVRKVEEQQTVSCKTAASDSESVNDTHDSSVSMVQEQTESRELIQDTVQKTDTCEAQKEEIPENVLAEVLGILTQFISELQELVKVDNQELMIVTEQLQFELHDFFDADRIKELFLQVNNADAAELLTNENLYDTLEKLQMSLSGKLENSDLPIAADGSENIVFDMAKLDEQLSLYIKKQNLIPDDVTSEIQEKELVIELEPVQNRVQETDIVTDIAPEHASQNEMEFADSDSDKNSNSFDADRGFEQATMFLNKLVNSAKTDAEVTINANNAIDLYDIASQIIEQVKLQIRPDNTKMELQLNPEHLGKVELEITSKNGELSARLQVQNDQVKEAVESQIQVLRETLELQGLKVETIEVTVAEFGFRFQDEQGNAEQFQQKQQRNRFIDMEEPAETEEFSDVAKVMQELNGNSVDYVA